MVDKERKSQIHEVTKSLIATETEFLRERFRAEKKETLSHENQEKFIGTTFSTYVYSVRTYKPCRVESQNSSYNSSKKHWEPLCLRLPSLTADWLEHALIPVQGVLGSDPAVSGMISGELILAAGFIKSTLWQGLAQYFDFDSHLN